MATAGDRRGAGPERAIHSPLPDAGVVTLSREESHHLVRVRRARSGDEIVLTDGEGVTRRARLVSAQPDGAQVEVLDRYPAREPRRSVTVAVAWPDGTRGDDLVSTLAELGVERVIPLICARSPGDTAARVTARGDRYRRLIEEALKVNGASRRLVVESPQGLADVCRAYAQPAACPRKAILLDTDPQAPSLSLSLPPAPQAVLLLVGPEGGFVEEELETARAAGIASASVGGCALRIETAAVAAAAVVLA